MVCSTVVLTLFSYTDLLLVKPTLLGEKVRVATAAEKDNGSRVKPKCHGKLYRCINIIYTDLLLVKPTLQYDGHSFRCGPRKVSGKSVRQKMKMGHYIPCKDNQKPIGYFLKIASS